jgi:putative transposase
MATILWWGVCHWPPTARTQIARSTVFGGEPVPSGKEFRVPEVERHHALGTKAMRIGEDSHDGRHRKTVKHGHEPGDLHELTFSCYRRWPLLTSDDRLELLARQIDLANQACRMELVAFVFMPEHVHLLVNPVTSDPQIDKYLAMIKQPVSRCVRKLLKAERNQLLLDQLTVHERPGKLAFRFWQEGPGFDRNLFTQPAILGSLNYIHENPVKRGLCAKAVDWKWSSARYYLVEPPRQQFANLPFVHGLPPDAWDSLAIAR